MTGLVTATTLAGAQKFAISAGQIVLANWKYVIIGVLALSTWHLDSRAVYWHEQYQTVEKQIKADRDQYTAAQKKAADDNKAAVAATEGKWQATVAKTQDEYQNELQAAYASVASYAKRLRQTAPAVAGPPGATPVSEAPGPSGATSGAGQDTVVPVTVADLDVCAANTVKAKGWQSFYAGLRQQQ